MTQAFVHVVLPSLMSSSKLASLGEVVGTIEQDRATAIAGTLGAGPSMLPIRLALDTDRGPRREFKFCVVRDQLFTPLLTYLSVVNTLKSYEREFGTSSFMVKGRALVDQHDEIAFEDLFTGDSPSIGAASYIAGPITFLLKNDFEPVEINKLDLTIVSSESPRTATLERVWLDAPAVKRGRTVPVKMLVRNCRGDEVIHTVPVDIPANANGSAHAAGRRRQPPGADRTARDAAEPAAAGRRANGARRSTRRARTTASTCGSSAPTRAPSSEARRWRRCRRRCLRSSTPTAAAAPSPAVAAPRSASGRFRPNTPSAAPRRSRSTSTTTELRPARRSSAILHFMARTFFGPSRPLSLVSLARLVVHGAGARFWEVGTLADFLKGDVTSLSVDLHGRLVLGPALTEVADTAARCSGRAWAPRRRPLSRLGQRRPGADASRATARAACSSIPRSSRSTRSRAPRAAGSTSARRPTAGSTRSTPPARAPSSSIRTTSTSGRLRSTPRARCSPPPATRASIYRITPDGKGAVFYRTKATHVRALLLTADRRAAGRHRIARAACSGSARTAAAFSCSTRGFRRSARCAPAPAASSTPRR